MMMYVRFPLSLRHVEYFRHERDIDFCHENVRHWWNKSGAMFAGKIRMKRYGNPEVIVTDRFASYGAAM